MTANEQVPESFDPQLAKQLLAANTPVAVEAGLCVFVVWEDTPQGDTTFWDDQAACRTLFPKGRAIIEEWLRLSESACAPPLVKHIVRDRRAYYVDMYYEVECAPNPETGDVDAVQAFVDNNPTYLGHVIGDAVYCDSETWDEGPTSTFRKPALYNKLGD